MIKTLIIRTKKICNEADKTNDMSIKDGADFKFWTQNLHNNKSWFKPIYKALYHKRTQCTLHKTNACFDNICVRKICTICPVHSDAEQIKE